jgi:hypothetical protein
MNRSKFIAISIGIIFSLLTFYADAYNEATVDITILKSDNLINICKKYLENPGKWREIAKINRLKNPDLVYPGQVIHIPVSLLKGVPADGLVSFVKGIADVQPQGSKEWKPLSMNDRVKEGSKIRTDDQSAVEITFEDGNSFLQSSGTTIGLSTARKTKANLARYKLFLDIGKTITKIKSATGRESRFEIETPSSVCAVRGTVFRTSVDADDATRSEVLQGIVDVAAMNHKVKVNEGEGTLVNKGEPPLSPKKLLSPPEITNLLPIYKNIPLRFEPRQLEGAVSYRALLSKDIDFKDIIKEKTLNPGEPFMIYDINDGAYFLQVRGIDNLGLEGLPSDTSVIKIRINPLPPIIEFPVGGSVYKDGTLTFKWLKVNDAVRYHIQIAEDKNFDKTIVNRTDIKDTGVKIQDLEIRTYYFRVRSVAADNYQGEWSDILNFSTVK